MTKDLFRCPCQYCKFWNEVVAETAKVAADWMVDTQRLCDELTKEIEEK